MKKYKNKSIIYIISGIGTGGAEMMLHKITSNLINKNINIKCIISLSTHKDELGNFKNLNIRLINLNFKNIIFIPFNFLRLIFFLIKYKPDIVHTWMYHADFIGGLAAKITSVKLIIWGIRNSYSQIHNKKLTKFVIWLCAKCSYYIPNVITSNSNQAIKDHILLGYCVHKFKFIPNGFDVTNFNFKINLRNFLFLDNDTVLIAHIGRFHPQKNHIGFIEAAKIINITYPNIHFVMIGKDINIDNKIIYNKIKDYNLHKRFHLLGLIENLNEVISNFNFLVSTSYGEGFPNIIGEAMASNVICISTNVGDCKEIINQYGFITNDITNIDIANSISDALSKSTFEINNIKSKAKNRIETLYNINTISNKYLEIYNIK